MNLRSAFLRKATEETIRPTLREFNLDAWRIRDHKASHEQARDRLRLGAEDFTRLEAADFQHGPDEIEITFPVRLEAAALGCARQVREDWGFSGILIASGAVGETDRRLLTMFGFDRILPHPAANAAVDPPAPPSPSPSPIGQAEYQASLFWSF